MHRVALTIALFTAGWMVMVSTPPMVQAGPPAAQTRVALAGGALTVETLGQLLKNMGYAPKAEGNLGYRLVFKDADWTYHISVSLSPDGNHLWLNFPLMPIQDLEKVPAASLLRLMAENELIGRAVESVAFSPDGQTLASASADGTVKLWTVATGREQATLTGHTNGKSWRWQPEVRGTCS